MDKTFDLLPITVLDQYEDNGPQEERWSGFLTSPNHAMFVEQAYGTLMIVEVKPTNDPAVYLAVPHTMELGHVGDPSKNAETVEAVVKMLNSMTAYEFLAKVMLNVSQDVDFKDMIVPIPSDLESGVA